MGQVVQENPTVTRAQGRRNPKYLQVDEIISHSHPEIKFITLTREFKTNDFKLLAESNSNLKPKLKGRRRRQRDLK